MGSSTGAQPTIAVDSLSEKVAEACAKPFTMASGAVSHPPCVS